MTVTINFDQEFSGFLSLSAIREFLRWRVDAGDAGDIYDTDGVGVGYWEAIDGEIVVTTFA